jgi:8-oxo-dGTP pyrophosphatase MutT (NUDIX family)
VKYDTARPFAASFVLLRRGNKVAFVLRSNTDWMNNHYGLVAGKVEKDETFVEAAVREAKEEAGVTVSPENLKHVLTCYRKAEDETEAWIDIIFEASAWDGEPFNAEPAKHSSLEWLDLDNLPENMIPVSHFYFENIKAGNTFCEYGW